jgi:hypothetical protein
VAHDAKVLETWDHTSHIKAQIYNLICVVTSFGGKSRIKPRVPAYFHPYRETVIPGLKVTPKNIGVLKLIAGALSRR